MTVRQYSVQCCTQQRAACSVLSLRAFYFCAENAIATVHRHCHKCFCRKYCWRQIFAAVAVVAVAAVSFVPIPCCSLRLELSCTVPGEDETG